MQIAFGQRERAGVVQDHVAPTQLAGMGSIEIKRSEIAHGHRAGRRQRRRYLHRPAGPDRADDHSILVNRSIGADELRDLALTGVGFAERHPHRHPDLNLARADQVGNEAYALLEID